ncbi:hypothetical protein V5G28_022635 [Scytonema sp. PRP1]
MKRNEGTWLAFQIAYLLGLQQVLNQEKSLQRPWLDRAIVWDTQRMRVESEISPSSPSSSSSPSSLMRPLQDAQLQELLKTLRPGKLTDTQADSGFKGNNFHLSLLEWLELEHPRCLLILDGLDELPPYSH